MESAINFVPRVNDSIDLAANVSRSNRYFRLGEGWYFSTREGATLGPYDTQQLAENAVSDYVEFVKDMRPSARRILKPS